MSRSTVVFLITLAVSLSVGSALAGECAAVPLFTENGVYTGCEVIHGTEVLDRTPEEVAEAACPKTCEGLNEMDELAAESHVLDAEAGFGSVDR